MFVSTTIRADTVDSLDEERNRAVDRLNQRIDAIEELCDVYPLL